MLTATIDDITPTGGEAFVIDYTVRNSDPDSTLGGALEITVDGERASAPSVAVDGGESVSDSNQVNGVSPGSHSVCVIADGSGDCGSVVIPEPTPDESRAEVELDTAYSPSSGVVVAEWSVRNVVETGAGERLGVSVRATVDGSGADTQAVTVDPGSIVTGTTRWEGVADGDREVCVEQI